MNIDTKSKPPEKPWSPAAMTVGDEQNSSVGVIKLGEGAQDGDGELWYKPYEGGRFGSGDTVPVGTCVAVDVEGIVGSELMDCECSNNGLVIGLASPTPRESCLRPGGNDGFEPFASEGAPPFSTARAWARKRHFSSSGFEPCCDQRGCGFFFSYRKFHSEMPQSSSYVQYFADKTF